MTTPSKEPNPGADANGSPWQDFMISPEEPILVTGASGFIGSKVIESLVALGCRNIRCFARPSTRLANLEETITRQGKGAKLSLFRGNLLSKDDCLNATRDIAVVIHLAAGRG